ncbi:hypothetical protein ACKKBG_A38260 [Auxenochlorella protothecoides x Auxenochlorella symbiontica]
MVQELGQESGTAAVHSLAAPHTKQRVGPEVDRHIEGWPWVSKRACQVVLDRAGQGPLLQTGSMVRLVQQDSQVPGA